MKVIWMSAAKAEAKAHGAMRLDRKKHPSLQVLKSSGCLRPLFQSANGNRHGTRTGSRYGQIKRERERARARARANVVT